MYFFRFKTGRQKIGLGLILVGIISFAAVFSFRTYEELKKQALSFSQVPELKTESKEELSPSQIIIPSLKIDLPVAPGKVIDDVWEISDTGASYLLGSGIPGKPGNMVIYGHNKRKLFGPILWIKKGAEIKIENKKGETFNYLVEETKTVLPTHVEVLMPTENSMVTIYTCTGFMDTKRFVVTATLKN